MVAQRTQVNEPPPLEGEVDRERDGIYWNLMTLDGGYWTLWANPREPGGWSKAFHGTDLSRRRLAVQLAEARGLLEQIQAECFVTARFVTDKVGAFLAGKATSPGEERRADKPICPQHRDDAEQASCL